MNNEKSELATEIFVRAAAQFLVTDGYDESRIRSMAEHALECAEQYVLVQRKRDQDARKK